MTDRQIPIDVPAGWSPQRWADHCRHMARACREVRPDLSCQWNEAADHADPRPAAPVGLEALLFD